MNRRPTTPAWSSSKVLVDTEEQPYGTHLNAKMAQGLDAKIIIVAAPGRDTPAPSGRYRGSRGAALTAVSAMSGCSAVFINLLDAPVDQTGHIRFDFSRAENGYNPGHETQIIKECKRRWPETFKLVGCIPWERELIAPRVRGYYADDWRPDHQRRATQPARHARRVGRTHPAESLPGVAAPAP
jgi:hypothetical protein